MKGLLRRKPVRKLHTSNFNNFMHAHSHNSNFSCIAAPDVIVACRGRATETVTLGEKQGAILVTEQTSPGANLGDLFLRKPNLLVLNSFPPPPTSPPTARLEVQHINILEI